MKGKYTLHFLVAMVVIIISFVYAEQIWAYTSVNGTVICTSGKVRSDADTKSAVVFCVKKEESIIIIDEKKDAGGSIWYQVKLGTQTGYIRSDLVKKGAEIVGTKTEASTLNSTSTNVAAVKTNTGTIKGTNVIVRVEASRTSDVRCTLGTGHEVNIESSVTGSDSNTWYYVNFVKNALSYKGYIRSDLLNTSTTVTSTGTTGSTSTTGNTSTTVSTGVVKGSNVNVRADASTSGKIVATLNSGFVVALSESSTDSEGKKWYKVTCTNNGQTVTGYIREDLLTIEVKTVAGASAAASVGTIKGTGIRVRTTASLTSNVSCGLSTGQQVSIIGTENADQKKWYKVAFTYNNEAMTGYVCADYVETTAGSATATAAVTTTTTSSKVGTVKGTDVNVRKEPVTGEIITKLSGGQIATVTEEKTGSDGKKWYGISFALNGENKTGYIHSDFMTVEEVVTTNTVPSTTTGTAGTSNRSGAVRGINVNVRKEPVSGAVVCSLSTGHTVTVTEEKKASDGKVWYAVAFIYNNTAQSGYICSDYLTVEAATVSSTTADQSTKGTIKGSAVRIRESAVNGTVVVQLSTDYTVTIIGETTGSDGYKWYQISFSYGGVSKTGYVRSDLVNIIQTASTTTLSSEEFEKAIIDFPDIYKGYLRTLHEKYPKWAFEPVKTGLEWNDVVNAETVVGKNLIAKSSISSWKSTAPQAYDWTRDAWYGFDGESWVAASPEIVTFYLDPRNFLNESGIFQFETLAKQDYQNEAGVSNTLASTFMNGSFTDTDGATRSYASLFVEAGKNAGVSPYYLAARCLQEQGTLGTSGSISGTVSGLENIFNFFNIGAYAANGNSSTVNGLIYAAGTEEAYARPWNTKYKSIMGSAKYVGEKYVNKNQNTLYFQKFNVVNTSSGLYSHQYMSNIQAASSEAARMKKAYSDLNAPLVFRIPIYNNMPATICTKPESTSNPNNYLSALCVDGYGLSPGFSPIVDSYALSVDNNVAQVNISATPVNAGASVAGAGTINLNVGVNQITVTCKAQNGNTKNYVMTITRNN